MPMRLLMAVAFVSSGILTPVFGFQTAAVFPVSWVEHVDHRNHLLTFKTEDGQVRMMRVADQEAMRREGLSKGDLVSIEVDLDDQIVSIVKVDRRAEFNGQMSRRK